MANTDKETPVRGSRGRQTRTPVGVRNKLNVRNKEPGYVYRIVNDVDDRVLQFKDADWEVASGNEKIGDSRTADQPGAEGSVKQVSVGNGTKAVLMRIRQEYYDDDQRAKQRLINEKESATKHKKEGQYGNIETHFGT